MQGESVIVELRKPNGKDDLGAVVYSTFEFPVEDVLVAPGPCADIDAKNSPDGHLARYTLYFPKSFARQLEGLRIRVRGHWCKVIGAPDHFSDENVPTRWWMQADVEAING